MIEKSIHDLTFTLYENGRPAQRPRNNELGFNITNTCQVPHKSLLINYRGECYICECEPFLPISVGNIESFNRLDEVWNNPVAKIIQKDIDNKKYTHCAVDRCGILEKDIIREHFTISINIDQSCNLKCPSCRKDLIMHTSGDIFDVSLKRVNHIVKLLNDFNNPCDIIMCGNGDPLASLIMRPLVYDLNLKENQTITLFTNGLMLKHHLPKSNIIDKIKKYQISIDAGSKEVYEQVRLGGNFDSLLENLNYLHSITHNKNISVSLFFCCQQKNYNDMFNFIDLCKKYNFFGVISRLENWGTWSENGIDTFQVHDVIANAQHPEHTSAIQQLIKIYNDVDTRRYLHPHLTYLIETKFMKGL